MSRFRSLPVSFYRRPAEEVARDLLGRWLVRDLDGERLVLRLVEVEAYLGAPDRASHAWGGRRTLRNASLYLAGGHAYVYFIYGMHWCLNAVTQSEGVGEAVLIRAIEPLEGLKIMRRNRGIQAERLLCSGPARLCQAFGIARAHNGLDLTAEPLYITGEPPQNISIRQTPRIGIRLAADRPWRYHIAGNPFVSR